MKISNHDLQESRAAIPKGGKHKSLSYRKPRRNADLMLSKPLFELQKVVQSHSTVNIENVPPIRLLRASASLVQTLVSRS